MPQTDAAPAPAAAPAPVIQETIEVAMPGHNEAARGDSTRHTSEAPNSDGREPRKQKRRSGNSVDLTYRYHEPSDDDLSWSEDEHGNRRRRKSGKRKSGGGDDFKNGIVPSEGKKRRRGRRSAHAQGEEDESVYSGLSENESESDSGTERKPRKKRESGKGDDFKTGILPRESKPHKKRRKSSMTNQDEPEAGHNSDGGFGEMQSHEPNTPPATATPPKVASPATQEPPKFPELGDGFTNVEWTILEHTHDHIRSLGNEDPESLDPTKLAEEFLKIYATSEYRKKAEEEGKERKVFSVEEVRDRIVALREVRERRKSGDLPPAPKLGSPASVKSSASRRLSGFLNFAKFW